MPSQAARQRRAQRHSRLVALGYRGYAHYLGSTTWNRVKVAYRESELPQDCICGEEDVDLHHTTYERVGEERLTDLTPLCRRCHTMIHVLVERGEIGLDFTGFVSGERAKRYQAQQRDQGDQSWAALHREEASKQLVMKIKRDLRSLSREALELGKGPLPILDRINGSLRESIHESANAGLIPDELAESLLVTQ